MEKGLKKSIGSKALFCSEWCISGLKSSLAKMIPIFPYPMVSILMGEIRKN